VSGVVEASASVRAGTERITSINAMKNESWGRLVPVTRSAPAVTDSPEMRDWAEQLATTAHRLTVRTTSTARSNLTGKDARGAATPDWRRLGTPGFRTLSPRPARTTTPVGRRVITTARSPQARVALPANCVPQVLDTVSLDGGPQ
jgi:hypothetical protein